MTRESVGEYAARQRERYQQASRTEKRQLLDEVVAVTGFHRKAAIRLLSRRRRRGCWPATGTAVRARCGSVCRAQGIVVNWRGSLADLSLDGEFSPPSPEQTVLLHLTDDEYQLLRAVLVLDLERVRMVMAARHLPEGIRLTGSPELIQDLIDCVAAEGNERAALATTSAT